MLPTNTALISSKKSFSASCSPAVSPSPPHRQHWYLSASTTSPATATLTHDESEKTKIFIPELTPPIKVAAYMRRAAAEGETKVFVAMAEARRIETEAARRPRIYRRQLGYEGGF